MPRMTNAPATPTPHRPSTLGIASLTLALNVVVIVQGVLVRGADGGAGCGDTWPTCQGVLLPAFSQAETTIGFTHRALSLAAFVGGAWLLRRASAERAARPGLHAFALAAFGLALAAALLGALSVLLGLVADDRPLARGLLTATHLVIALLLVGSLTVSVLHARARAPGWPLHLARQGGLLTVVLVGLVGMLVLTFSGGIAAMGNTLFPAASLMQGSVSDFGPGSHPLVRLRYFHPLIAMTVGVYLVVSLGLAWWLKPVAAARPLVRALLGVYALQLAVGTANLVFLAPLALQMLHLGLATLAFALLCSVSVTLLGAPQRRPVPIGQTALGESA
jgi:heme A synthase